MPKVHRQLEEEIVGCRRSTASNSMLSYRPSTNVYHGLQCLTEPTSPAWNDLLSSLVNAFSCAALISL
jgi:hypothetical protein